MVAPLVGAWIEIANDVKGNYATNVAPLVGAWIEIVNLILGFYVRSASLLSWERGLKFQSRCRFFRKHSVAPLVGAWIEILLAILIFHVTFVAPLVGAWIEILKQRIVRLGRLQSLLSWERGLK